MDTRHKGGHDARIVLSVIELFTEANVHGAL